MLTDAGVQNWTGPPVVWPDVSFQYCQLDADYGLSCKSTNETAWFYNRTSGACETFLFGGCLGNQNRFLSHSICYSVCVLRSIRGPPGVFTGSTEQPEVGTPPVRYTRRNGESVSSTEAPPRRPSPRPSRASTTPATNCAEVDCAGKDCSVSGFAEDIFGCRLCICADPCEVSVFMRAGVSIRRSYQCSRIRILRSFFQNSKNAFFTFFWNDMSKKRRKHYKSFSLSAYLTVAVSVYSSPLRSLSNRWLTLCALKQQTITYTYKLYKIADSKYGLSNLIVNLHNKSWLSGL